MDEDPFTPPGGARLLVEAERANIAQSKVVSAAGEAEAKDEDGRGNSSSPSIVLFDDKQKNSKNGKDKEKAKDCRQPHWSFSSFSVLLQVFWRRPPFRFIRIEISIMVAPQDPSSH